MRDIGAVFDTERGTPGVHLGDAGLATAAVGVGAVTARAAGLPLACPLHAATGIPCPGCGMTRLADAVVGSDPSGVIAADPLGAIVLSAIAALAVVGLAQRLGVVVRPSPAARSVPAALLAVLVVRWLLLLAGLGPDIG